MAVNDPQKFPGDLILRTRTGVNQKTGRTEKTYWLDTLGGSLHGKSFSTFLDALFAGRLRAQEERVTLWEDVTSVTSAGQRLRLEVSFRPR
jgi:hypothetical protein